MFILRMSVNKNFKPSIKNVLMLVTFLLQNTLTTCCSSLDVNRSKIRYLINGHILKRMKNEYLLLKPIQIGVCNDVGMFQ